MPAPIKGIFRGAHFNGAKTSARFSATSILLFPVLSHPSKRLEKSRQNTSRVKYIEKIKGAG